MVLWVGNPETASTFFNRGDMYKITPPKHYSAGDIQPWDVIIDWKLGFFDGNAVKYICRAGKKDGATALEDYKKALNYIQEKVRQIESDG
tara:strand:+ start:2811 stop:3080 length:270 start_codon:yes stop_codon:yes gene_type:complete